MHAADAVLKFTLGFKILISLLLFLCCQGSSRNFYRTDFPVNFTHLQPRRPYCIRIHHHHHPKDRVKSISHKSPAPLTTIIQPCVMISSGVFRTAGIASSRTLSTATSPDVAVLMTICSSLSLYFCHAFLRYLLDC